MRLGFREAADEVAPGGIEFYGRNHGREKVEFSERPRRELQAVSDHGRSPSLQGASAPAEPNLGTLRQNGVLFSGTRPRSPPRENATNTIPGIYFLPGFVFSCTVPATILAGQVNPQTKPNKIMAKKSPKSVAKKPAAKAPAKKAAKKK